MFIQHAPVMSGEDGGALPAELPTGDWEENEWGGMSWKWDERDNDEDDEDDDEDGDD